MTKNSQTQQIKLLSHFRNWNSETIIFMTHLCLRWWFYWFKEISNCLMKNFRPPLYRSFSTFSLISPSLWPKSHSRWVQHPSSCRNPMEKWFQHIQFSIFSLVRGYMLLSAFSSIQIMQYSHEVKNSYFVDLLIKKVDGIVETRITKLLFVSVEKFNTICEIPQKNQN